MQCVTFIVFKKNVECKLLYIWKNNNIKIILFKKSMFFEVFLIKNLIGKKCLIGSLIIIIASRSNMLDPPTIKMRMKFPLVLCRLKKGFWRIEMKYVIYKNVQTSSYRDLFSLVRLNLTGFSRGCNTKFYFFLCKTLLAITIEKKREMQLKI